MGFSYNKLWKLLIDKGIKRTQLLSLAGIHPNTLAALSKGQPVSMDTLEKLCKTLNCSLHDIVEYVPDPPEPTEKG